MYVNNPSMGLKLIDFIDTLNSDNIDSDLIDFVTNFLAPCKKYFYINDEILFNNFCELFALHFYSRTFNFDTTFELNMKLRNVLLMNKKKYEQIYKASLYEIDPLITYKHTIEDTESKNGQSDTTSTTQATNETNNETSGENSATSITSGENSSKSIEYATPDYKDITTNATVYGSSVTGDNKHLISNTPQSNLNVSELFTSTKYVSNAENTNDSSTKSGTDTTTSTKTFEGEKFNDVKSDYGDNTQSDSTFTTSGRSSGSSESSGMNQNTFSDSREYKRLEQGFNGDQMELLEKFSNLVFDVHKEIINDIEKAHLFSTYFL